MTYPIHLDQCTEVTSAIFTLIRFIIPGSNIEIAPALMLVLIFLYAIVDKKNRDTLLCLSKMKVTCKITLCTSFLLLVDLYMSDVHAVLSSLF